MLRIFIIVDSYRLSCLVIGLYSWIFKVTGELIGITYIFDN